MGRSIACDLLRVHGSAFVTSRPSLLENRAVAPLRWLLRSACAALWAALVFALLEGLALAAPLPRDVTLAPTPAWVAKVTASSSAPAPESETGISDLLMDDQLRVTSTLEHYRHRVRQITSAAGVEEGAELEITFDPSHERFVLHGLHIVRGGQRIDATKTSTVRTFDSEDGRDQQIYDGSRRVVFLLADLRPGDRVDFESSVVGANPVFGGRVARRFALASARACSRRRVRVVSPVARPLSFRLDNTKVAATTRTVGTESEWVWEQADTAAFTAEDDAPDWFDARPFLSVSEFASWSDVALWAYELYERTPRPSAALTAKIAEIRAAHPTAATRAQAAVRFVQDDIRYLGIELGEHSHRPHSASAVFEQRFGDCKDKVMLLVTMSRALGVEADPALVDTKLGAHIIDELPSAQAFDHVIARLRLDGRDVWVDPTRMLERGPLGSSEVPFGRALIASKDTKDLAVIPLAVPAQPTTVVRETLRVKEGASELEVMSTYRGAAANDMRYTLGHTPRSKTKSANLEYYAKTYPGIAARGDLVVEDNEASNVLVVRELYTIRELVVQGGISLWAYSVAARAKEPSVTHRESPLYIGSPEFVRHEIVIEGLELALPQPATVSDAAVSFSMRSEQRPNGGMVTYELQTRADSVSAADLATHLETLSSIRDALGEDALVAIPQPAAAPTDKRLYLWLGLGAFALFIGSVVTIVCAWLAWSSGRRLRWRRTEP
jgi:hypothetical protein